MLLLLPLQQPVLLARQPFVDMFRQSAKHLLAGAEVLRTQGAPRHLGLSIAYTRERGVDLGNTLHCLKLGYHMIGIRVAKACSALLCFVTFHPGDNSAQTGIRYVIRNGSAHDNQNVLYLAAAICTICSAASSARNMGKVKMLYFMGLNPECSALHHNLRHHSTDCRNSAGSKFCW